MISQVCLHSCHFVDKFLLSLSLFVYISRERFIEHSIYSAVPFAVCKGRPLMGFKDTMLIDIYIHLLFL